jgi:hypothetical protein
LCVGLIRIGNFSLDGSSHQTGDAAFTPATPRDLQHSRANTDSHNSHNTQHARVEQNTLCFMQKGTEPRDVLENTSLRTRLITDAGDTSLLIGSIHFF